MPQKLVPHNRCSIINEGGGSYWVQVKGCIHCANHCYFFQDLYKLTIKWCYRSRYGHHNGGTSWVTILRPDSMSSWGSGWSHFIMSTWNWPLSALLQFIPTDGKEKNNCLLLSVIIQLGTVTQWKSGDPQFHLTLYIYSKKFKALYLMPLVLMISWINNLKILHPQPLGGRLNLFASKE